MCTLYKSILKEKELGAGRGKGELEVCGMEREVRTGIGGLAGMEGD